MRSNSSYSYLTKNVIPTEDILVKRAHGVKLWDQNGKKYLDFSSQTLNTSLGNSPQIAKKAFLKQFNKFTFLSTRFGSEVFLNLSKELVRIAPPELTKANIKLTNGSDANESAFKRARIFRKKPKIVSFYKSHLGETCETLKASSPRRLFIGGSNSFLYVEAPFFNNRTEKDVLTNIELIFKKRDDVAAIVIEPVMVNAGLYIFSKLFLQELRRLCNKYKVTLIFDEIQTAFGWLGKIFAADYFGVCPDILTVGKAFAAGFPLAGVILREEYDVINYGIDEFTYGGHPISCAIALENIKILTNFEFLRQINEKIDLFKLLLQKSLQNKTEILEIRHCGLMAGIEFSSTIVADSFYKVLLEKGLIVRKSMDGRGSSLVLKPPLITSKSTIKKAVEILEKNIVADYLKA